MLRRAKLGGLSKDVRLLSKDVRLLSKGAWVLSNRVWVLSTRRGVLELYVFSCLRANIYICSPSVEGRDLEFSKISLLSQAGRAQILEMLDYIPP